jgi:two-component system, NtrC family, response regulator AtoC
MPNETILVVDDDQMIRLALSHALKGWGYSFVEAETISEGLSKFDENIQAVLLDVNLPDGSGLELLRSVKSRTPNAIVVMMTGNPLVDDTIAALRSGAYDFISKPINLDELRVTLRNALETGQLRKELESIRGEISRTFSFEQIVGESEAIQATIRIAKKVASSEASSVLLQGESGTGKDLFAKAIHYGSARATGPFVPINCAAIPANLIESELFGFEKGAFTDAKARKQGLFEQAEGGTVFLDEIGELELGLQSKLLRVIEEGAFRRVGGVKDIPLDIRIIAASNRNLRAESEAGRFRLDLYYRLAILQIDIPALRDRGEDVLLIAQYYLTRLGERMRRNIRSLSPEVRDAFMRYQWPGNVRELRNVIERALILEEGNQITCEYLPPGILEQRSVPIVDQTGAQLTGTSFLLPEGGISLDEVEMSLVKQAIQQSGGNQTRAAELLHISRDQLRYRLKRLEETSSKNG